MTIADQFAQLYDLPLGRVLLGFSIGVLLAVLRLCLLLCEGRRDLAFAVDGMRSQRRAPRSTLPPLPSEVRAAIGPALVRSVASVTR